MHHSLPRRQFLRLTSAVAAMPVISRPVSASLTDRKLDLPNSLPVGVKTIITEGLKPELQAKNTHYDFLRIGHRELPPVGQGD